MAKSQSGRQSVKLDDFIGKIIANPGQPEAFELLSGFVGESSENDHVRLYEDISLKKFMDIPNSGILHTAPIPERISPMGGSYLWVKKDTEFIFGNPASEDRAKSKLFEGDMVAGFSAESTAEKGGGMQAQYTNGGGICDTTRDGNCWTEGKCTDGWVCKSSASFCPMNTPGQGMQMQYTNGGGICDTTRDGNCWTEGKCTDGWVCKSSASFCPLNTPGQGMQMQYTNGGGICDTTRDGNCWTEGKCTDGWVCKSSASFCPLNTPGQGMQMQYTNGGGICDTTRDGNCWTEGRCTNGWVCKSSASFCPMNMPR
ncbi:hypothetical protein AB9P05_17200 [Roseivirga sp. BDSF3-8]|uniref:hypothetical protein n=1 Tax=Roseivirga sp. BDSF3-8 TaxID=3241598 RepID=UPI003531B562